MQILKNWNNLFTNGLQIHSSFYHNCFLYFVNFKKIKIWCPFVQIWWNLNFNQTNDVDLKKKFFTSDLRILSNFFMYFLKNQI
jgi:hypothetical protein